jgi:hypothetical protein
MKTGIAMITNILRNSTMKNANTTSVNSDEENDEDDPMHSKSLTWFMNYSD